MESADIHVYALIQIHSWLCLGIQWPIGAGLVGTGGSSVCGVFLRTRELSEDGSA